MKTQKPFYILRRLLTTLVLAVGSVSIAAIFFIVVFGLNKGEAELAEAADKSILNISQILIDPMWNIDNKGVGIVCDIFAQDKRIRKLSVYEAGGKLIHSVTNAGSWSWIQKSQNITRGGEILGRVDLDFSRGAYRAEVWRLALVGGAASLVSLLVAFITIQGLLRRYLRRPLDAMAKVIDEYQLGHYRVHDFDAGLKPYLEFRNLTETLGNMGERIHQQIAAIETSQIRLQQAMEATQDAIWEWHLPSRRLDYSPRLTAMLGQNAERFPPVIETFYGLLPEDQKERVKALLENAALTGDFFEIETQMRSEDGAWKWILLRGKTATFDEQRRPRLIIGTLVDLTSIKLAEEAKLLNEAMLRAFVDAIPEPAFLVDRQFQVMVANKAMTAKHGRSSGEWRGARLESIYSDPEILRERREQLTKTFQSGETLEFEVAEPGNFFRTLLYPARDFKGTIFAVAVLSLNINDRKRAEAMLLSSQKELEIRVEQRTSELAAANKDLESFSYSVSHDLRAPLRAIDGFSRALLEDHLEHLNEEGKKFLGIIGQETIRMGRLIDDLLQLAKVSRAEVKRVEVDVSKMARGIIDELRLEEPGRNVSAEIEDNLKLFGDEGLSRIVLVNLISNAWKFTGRTPRGEIRIGWTERDGKKNIFIRDNGSGFDMAYANKLFGSFQRLHTESEFPGTGIGLATVYRVIKLHGGSIWADAKVGEGAIFQFNLGEPSLFETDKL